MPMVPVYHVPTAYLIAGLVFLALPSLTWLTLRSERSKAVNWWVLGSMTVSAGLLVLGLRQSFPQLLPFNTGFTLVLLGLAMHIHVLSLQLERKPRLVLWLGLALGSAALKELAYRLAPASQAHYLMVYVLLAAVFGVAGRMAGQLHRKEGLNSARWLSHTNHLVCAAFCVRAITGVLALSHPPPLNDQLSGVLTTVLVLGVSLMHNFLMIGIYLERSHQRNARLRVEEERARAAAELTAEVGQLDRQRSMGELAAGLAHELSQPITCILLSASTLKEALEQAGPEAEAQSSMAQDVLEQGVRARRILEGIRNFIQPGDQRLTPLNLTEVIAGTQAMLAHALRHDGVQVQVRCTSDWPWVHGDVVQLSQVFLNLLRNCLQARRPQAPLRIEVGVHEAGDMLEVVVEDNGQGMRDEEMARSATPFFTTKPDGLGVGLAISRRIMEHHGGSLALAHADSGTGLKVTLRLPRMASVVQGQHAPHHLA